MRWKAIVITLVAAISVAGLIGVILVVTHQGSCTIGVFGYAANIEFSGANAQAVCDNLVKSGVPDNHGSTLGMYSESGPSGNELCEGNLIYGGPTPNLVTPPHYVVRDSGSVMLIGNYLCTYLLNSGG